MCIRQMYAQCTKRSIVLGCFVIHIFVSAHLSGKRNANIFQQLWKGNNAQLRWQLFSRRMVCNIRFQQDLKGEFVTIIGHCENESLAEALAHLGSFRETIQQWNCAADWRIKLCRGKCHLKCLSRQDSKGEIDREKKDERLSPKLNVLSEMPLLLRTPLDPEGRVMHH